MGPVWCWIEIVCNVGVEFLCCEKKESLPRARQTNDMKQTREFTTFTT